MSAHPDVTTGFSATGATKLQARAPGAVRSRIERSSTLPALSIVIPTYRQVEVIGPQVAEILASLDELDFSYEVLVVVDGDDGSAKELGQLRHKHLRVSVLESNEGKGNAVRYGLLKVSGVCRGFIDGGGDIHINDFLKAYEQFVGEAADIVVASKLHRDSEVNYPLLRRMYSWGYRQLTRLLFGLNVHDTQVGLKLYSAPVVEQVFPHVRTPGFAFDIESLALARRLGFHTIHECPVTITNRYPSTIGIGTATGMFFETLRIFWRLRRFSPDSRWSLRR